MLRRQIFILTLFLCEHVLFSVYSKKKKILPKDILILFCNFGLSYGAHPPNQYILVHEMRSWDREVFRRDPLGLINCDHKPKCSDLRKPGSAIFIGNFVGNVTGSFRPHPEFHRKLHRKIALPGFRSDLHAKLLGDLGPSRKGGPF